MSLVLEQLLNGIQYGFLLFLIAAGLSLVLVATTRITSNFVIAALIAVVVVALCGLVIEAVIARRLYDRAHLDQVLATFGLILLINEATRLIAGSNPLFVPTPDALSGTILLGSDVQYPVYRLVVTGVSIGVAIALWFVITRTRLGMQMRAAASNAPMVRALGLNATTIYAAVFGLGAALAGLAGVLSAPFVSVQIGMDENVLILAFVIVVLGGVGSVRGCFVAALIVGLTDTVGRAFLPYLLATVLDPPSVSAVAATLSAMLVYLLMIVTLAFKPAGIFSR
jgi:branched-chain amino acid transport system permease protein